MELLKFRHHGVPVPIETGSRRYTGMCEIGDYQDHATRRVITTARFRAPGRLPGVGPVDTLLDVRLLWLSSADGYMMLTGYERIQSALGLSLFPQSWLIDLDLATLLPSDAAVKRNPAVWDVIKTHENAMPLKPTRLMERHTTRWAGFCEIRESYDPGTKRNMTVAHHSATPYDKVNFNGIRLLDARVETFDPDALRMRLSGFERTSLMANNPDCGQGWLIFMGGAPPLQQEIAGKQEVPDNMSDRQLRRFYAQR